ncbi:MAG: hypothetical protein M1812_002009 [Candelaria pacifica]|nr:MAG: hypothetical protein M1812_002009 [Candelaria pacifica]
MPDASNGDRAKEIAQKAVTLIDNGQKEEGTRALREAASLAPDNSDVRAAFSKIQDNDSIHPLLKQCRKLVNDHKEAAVATAIQYLERKDVQVPPDVGRECATLLLSAQGQAASSDIDVLIGLLLRQSLGARSLLAEKLVRQTTKLFYQLWDAGKGAVDGFIQVLLDPSAWASDSVRNICEKDGFRLLVAKLIEAGQDYQAMAMKGIARLLAADAEKLQALVDQDAFEAFLSSLDERLAIDLRSQATLAIAKYMEVAQDTAQEFLSNFITFRIGKQTKNDLIVAFSVAASIFPIVPSVAAALFLTEGFVESLAPLAKGTKSTEVEVTMLSMISAACIDQSCREAINKHCLEWLKSVARGGTGERKEKAALIIVKTQSTSGGASSARDTSATTQETEMDELVGMFRSMMASDEVTSKQSSIEGLAYASLRPTVKETIAHDDKSLKHLIETLKSSDPKSPLTFGGLSIFVNLTKYLPNLSEEQKRMGQLKAYANTSKAKSEPDPLEDDEHVTARCKAVLDAGILPLLVNISKTVSPTALSLILNILLSLSKTPKHRGQLAQQGAVKLLLSAYTSTPDTSPSTNPSQRIVAHALARILISVNPLLIFGSSSALPITSAIRPLLLLLEEDATSENRDLLSTFEGLLGLTNLASTEDFVRDTIVRLSWPKLEDLLLSNNPMLQRATVELVCNLMASPQCVSKFADGSPQAANRLHILLALADVDDYATRRAAGGGLAMLTEWDAAVDAVVKRERGVRILLGLCEEEEVEVVHRGVVCVLNVVSAPGDVGVRGREKVRSEGGVETFRGLVLQVENREVVELAVEVLKILNE